jgi:hypothetical protein
LASNMLDVCSGRAGLVLVFLGITLSGKNKRWVNDLQS